MRVINGNTLKLRVTTDRKGKIVKVSKIPVLRFKLPNGKIARLKLAPVK